MAAAVSLVISNFGVKNMKIVQRILDKYHMLPWKLTAWGSWIMVLFMILFISGCTTVVSTIAGVVAKPIFGLAVKDARTTLSWVNREVESGRLASIDAEAAKQCPLSVIALDELRSRMAAGARQNEIEDRATAEEGFKGLIYYGTLNRYGKGVQDEASRYLSDLASSCLLLIPAEKLMKVF